MTEGLRDIDIVADAFVAAHSEVHEGKFLVRDTLEKVVGEGIVDDVWNAIKRRYAALENPLGVYALPSDITLKLRQLVIREITDHRYPELLDDFRTRLKVEVFA